MGILLVYDVTDESSFNSNFSSCLGLVGFCIEMAMFHKNLRYLDFDSFISLLIEFNHMAWMYYLTFCCIRRV